MDKLKAIQYLIKKGVNGSEWQQAGMWVAVTRVMETQETLTKAYLDRLIENARSN